MCRTSCCSSRIHGLLVLYHEPAPLAIHFASSIRDDWPRKMDAAVNSTKVLKPNVTSTMAKSTNAIKILHAMVGNDPKGHRLLDNARVNAQIAQLIYDARTRAGLTQRQSSRVWRMRIMKVIPFQCSGASPTPSASGWKSASRRRNAGWQRAHRRIPPYTITDTTIFASTYAT
jgi:hypothetical protein